MKIKLSIMFLFCFVFKFYSQIGFFGNKENTIKRVEKAKQATVQVLVDNVKSGTGFFISSNGIIVTNFHVVINQQLKLNNKQEILNKFSIVDFKNDTTEVSIILDLSKQAITDEAMAWDYCILKTKKDIKTTFLKFGNLQNSYDGAPVYTCGYPLELNKAFLSTGTLASLDTQVISSKNDKRNIGWLDMTTNKGNSGGPLITLGNTPEEDEVIGISSFIIVPFYKELEGLNNYITQAKKAGGVEIMGINLLGYMELINTAANSNSVGISGCISIEKVSAVLKNYNK